MKNTDFLVLKFQIADVKFLYSYDEFIEIPRTSSINNFLNDFPKADIINYISFGAIEKAEPNEAHLSYKTPAWSWYNIKNGGFVVFHPRGNYISNMIINDDGSIAHTRVIDKNFTPYPLPISITGFLLQYHLNKRNWGFIMHGAAIDLRGNGIILSGNSGVGKSTLATLMKKELPITQITDDRIIVKFDNGFYAYGNPFDKKNDE